MTWNTHDPYRKEMSDQCRRLLVRAGFRPGRLLEFHPRGPVFEDRETDGVIKVTIDWHDYAVGLRIICEPDIPSFLACTCGAVDLGVSWDGFRLYASRREDIPPLSVPSGDLASASAWLSRADKIGWSAAIKCAWCSYGHGRSDLFSQLVEMSQGAAEMGMLLRADSTHDFGLRAGGQLVLRSYQACRWSRASAVPKRPPVYSPLTPEPSPRLAYDLPILMPVPSQASGATMKTEAWLRPPSSSGTLTLSAYEARRRAVDTQLLLEVDEARRQAPGATTATGLPSPDQSSSPSIHPVAPQARPSHTHQAQS